MLTKKMVESREPWKTALANKQLVYAMKQVHNLKVKGLPDTSDARKLYAEGICHSISLNWIVLRKKSSDYPHKIYEDKVGICHEISNKPYLLQRDSSSKASTALKNLGFRHISSVQGIMDVKKKYWLWLLDYQGLLHISPLRDMLWLYTKKFCLPFSRSKLGSLQLFVLNGL